MEPKNPNSIAVSSNIPLFSTTPKKSPPLSAVESTVATPERSNLPPRCRSLLRSDLSVRDSEKMSKSVDEDEMHLRSEKLSSILPEQYKMLCEFFDTMVNSIRLLRLKRLQSTFTKISQNIESLTERRFTVHHLAQLKHIVPEVIVVKKIRVQDEETKCMNEELLVTLETNAVEVDQNIQGSARFSHLKEIFQSRITMFYATHPEGDEVPEGELPHLFYMKKDPESSTNETSTSVPLSLISPSFKRRFSSRACSASLPEQFSVKPSSCLLETPIKETVSTKVEDASFSAIQKTPAEVASTPSKLMVATPGLCPPKRSFMSPDHDAVDLPTKSAKRRSLKFDEISNDIEDQPSQVGDKDNNAQSYTASKDVLKVLPKNLLHSLMEKERKILEEQDPVVSQTIKRQKLIAGVPKLFNMICHLFQSVGRSVITREELIHKIIAGHLNIIDRRELEEQLKLLQEIAPEYLSELPALSGDIILRLNKSSCPNSIRAKLLEAK